MLVLRNVDLALQKLDLHQEDLFVSSNISKLRESILTFSCCSEDSVVYINYDGAERKLRGKYFSREDGRILQDWNLIVFCSADGFKCKFEHPKRISVLCRDFKKSIQTKFVNWQNKRTLSQLNIFSENRKQNNFCCLNC